MPCIASCLCNFQWCVTRRLFSSRQGSLSSDVSPVIVAFSVTHYGNLQGYGNHMFHRPYEFIWMRNQASNFKFSSSVKCRPIGWVSKFGNFIGLESDHTIKREIISDYFIYKCANLQTLLMSRSICFICPNRAIQPSLSLKFQNYLNNLLSLKFHNFLDLGR
jgi:hypothetical protein